MESYYAECLKETMSDLVLENLFRLFGFKKVLKLLASLLPTYNE